MSTDLPLICGWHKDPAAVAENLQSWRESGAPVTAAEFSKIERPELVGYWESMKRKGVIGIFLADASKNKAVNGRYRRPFLQKEGTCVDRGTTFMVQLSLDFDIANRARVSRPVIIQFGTTYIGARGDIGRNTLRGAGAILGQAITTINTIGVMEKKVVGKYNFLNTPEDEIEQWIVQMSYAPLIADFKREMAGHLCKGFWCESLDRIKDCVSAGYGCPYAFDYVTGMPNAKGVSGIGSYGPHCRGFSGIYVDDTGRDRLVSHESWGRFPAGNPTSSDYDMPLENMPCITVRLADGSTKKLAPGEVGVDAEAFAQGIYNDGEVYAVSAPSGFEPDSLVAMMGA